MAALLLSIRPEGLYPSIRGKSCSFSFCGLGNEGRQADVDWSGKMTRAGLLTVLSFLHVCPVESETLAVGHDGRSHPAMQTQKELARSRRGENSFFFQFFFFIYIYIRKLAQIATAGKISVYIAKKGTAAHPIPSHPIPSTSTSAEIPDKAKNPSLACYFAFVLRLPNGGGGGRFGGYL